MGPEEPQEQFTAGAGSEFAGPGPVEEAEGRWRAGGLEEVFLQLIHQHLLLQKLGCGN